MNKVYKHRTMGRTTKKEKVDDDYVVNIGGMNYYVNKLIIDDFKSDREEVVEKDWISNVIEKFDGGADRLSEGSRKELRELLEQHAPQVKRFTTNDVKEWYNNQIALRQKNYGFSERERISYFLEDHNLLSEID